MKRIAIVGTSGSGKTTLAKALSKALESPHYELDGINWLPQWQERPQEGFRKIVGEKTREEAWVIEGNYARVRDLIWGRATAVIWINLPFRVVFTRILIRSIRRGLTREVLWSGNRESLFLHFFTRDSMLWWVIKTYSLRKREYAALFLESGNGGPEKIELRSQREVDAFLEEKRTVAR